MQLLSFLNPILRQNQCARLQNILLNHARHTALYKLRSICTNIRILYNHISEYCIATMHHSLYPILLVNFIRSSRSVNPGCVPNCIGSTPPLGARSWNSVRGNINQTFIQQSVLGLTVPLSSGKSLSSFGYSNYGIDDGWEACGAGVNGSFHDVDGFPMINLDLFPNM